jgi:hypothetical protein
MSIDAVCGPSSSTVRPTKKRPKKEVHFFDKNMDQHGSDYYPNLYRFRGNAAWALDATPSYIHYPERIYEYYKEREAVEELRVIFILREPVSREVSWYNHRVREYTKASQGEREYTSFIDEIIDNEGKVLPFEHVIQQPFVSAVEWGGDYQKKKPRSLAGYYAPLLRRWFTLFDRRKQILVLSYDELKKNPTSVLERIHQFLDVPMPPNVRRQRLNHAAKGTLPPPCEVQRALAAKFEGPNQELYELLEEYPGPASEQRPFPKFHFHCKRTRGEPGKEEERGEKVKQLRKR